MRDFVLQVCWLILGLFAAGSSTLQSRQNKRGLSSVEYGGHGGGPIASVDLGGRGSSVGGTGTSITTSDVQGSTFTRQIPVPVPRPVPVTVNRPIPVPVPVPYEVSIPRPVPVSVPQPVPVAVVRAVPVTVDRPVPVPVAHPVPVSVPQPYVVPVLQAVPVQVPQPVPVPVPHPITIAVPQAVVLPSGGARGSGGGLHGSSGVFGALYGGSVASLNYGSGYAHGVKE